MTKRKRTESYINKSDNESKFSPGSEIEDASFSLKPKKSNSAPKKTQKTRKKCKQDASATPPVDLQDHDGHASYMHSKSAHIVTSPAPVRTALLTWYKTVRDTRGMPWRQEYDPNLESDERAQRAYQVWISEIMLQQTQVATVIPYYNRWMEKFPTIRDLAAASIDDVNALWKGLGYYSRATRLLAGAQKAVKDYDGKLPDNAKEMEANIPGIGRYSAGAICSIAYGERVPVLDGNVHRLLSRFLALHASPKAKSTLDILWAAAQTFVEIEDDAAKELAESQSPQYPGDINQALIELGSTVCKVREPDCLGCPLQPWCSAWQNAGNGVGQVDTVVDIEDLCGLCEAIALPAPVTAYPMKNDRKKPREELDIVNVIEWHSKSHPEDRFFLMVRRPEGGLLAGLYEFPTTANVSTGANYVDQEAMLKETLSKAIQGVQSTSASSSSKAASKSSSLDGIEILRIQQVGDIIHVFSHIRKTYRVQWCVIEVGDNLPVIQETFPFNEERPTKSNKKKHPVPIHGVALELNPSNATWVPLEEVKDINMGTGVVKIWNKTKQLWEK